MEIELSQAIKNKRTGKIFTVTKIYSWLDISGAEDVGRKSYKITLVGGNWTQYWIDDKKINENYELIDLSFDDWKTLVNMKDKDNA